ncbi:MAG TPA: hypothetical protein PKB00_04280, partial [Microthrixaceae bacterium]|nr:hypothetical protein [Microthrixaceae bacterium]
LQLSPDFAGEPIDESRAEFAYFMGNVLSNMGRDALSADVYRFVFELDPKHAWASNNLGYMILERGGSIEEAARLLEQAHEGEPDASSIIDSLGWRDHVDLALSPADVGRGRPFPDLNLSALLRLGGTDVRALATVGDTAFDVLAGRASGAGVVAGVLSGAHDRDTLSAAGADHVIDTVADLPDLLANL